MCQCPACVSGAHCETKVEACTAIAKRRCNVKAGNKCEANLEIKDHCAYKCDCSKTAKISDTQCGEFMSEAPCRILPRRVLPQPQRHCIFERKCFFNKILFSAKKSPKTLWLPMWKNLWKQR
ncbi:hypothetical protein ANCCAN_22551 [Ancylostoma caninum]|uniref:Uncharacterized protein n=1 Tax=Ancylostoma caninum TaxID=29170 RepID=A0A368FHX0_ANCCA|nr:hypothetical protein ANCCAN_22551 [Ancylostoma caninum]